MKKMNKIDVLMMTDDKLDKVVKIQGTTYDRKRRISEFTLKQMLKMSGAGKTIAEIANKLDINPQMVLYHIDPIWRASYNANRSGKHYGKDRITIKNRVAYKRSLVAAGKVTVAA
jgi:predicted transcriptional regulator